MMHRVAVELKFPEMFFQLSIFITFKELLDVECSEYKVTIRGVFISSDLDDQLFAQFIYRMIYILMQT